VLSYYQGTCTGADLGGRRPHVNHNNVHTLLHNQRNNKVMSFKPGDKAMLSIGGTNDLVTVHSEAVNGWHMVTTDGMEVAPYIAAADALSTVPQEPNITIKVYAPGIQEVPTKGWSIAILHRALRDVLAQYDYTVQARFDVTWPNTQTVGYTTTTHY
jgi:hypothetical protein